MGLTLTQVHETAKDPNTGLDRITRENPYVRLKQGEFPPLYIQGGQVYDESGTVQKTMPAWFMEEIEKANPAQLARAGWKPAQKAAPKAATKPEPKAKTASKSQVKRINAQKPKDEPLPEPELGQEED
jgi:hypothetical protein